MQKIQGGSGKYISLYCFPRPDRAINCYCGAYFAQFGWAARPGMSPAVTKRLPFTDDGGHCSLGPSVLQTFFFYTLPQP